MTKVLRGCTPGIRDSQETEHLEQGGPQGQLQRMCSERHQGRSTLQVTMRTLAFTE